MTQALMIHLPVIDPAKALARARRVFRAPDPAAPPPVSIATRRDLFGTVGAMMLLTAAEAGASKTAELDGELLALCAQADDLDKESDRLYDLFAEESLVALSERRPTRNSTPSTEDGTRRSAPLPRCRLERRRGCGRKRQ